MVIDIVSLTGLSFAPGVTRACFNFKLIMRLLNINHPDTDKENITTGTIDHSRSCFDAFYDRYDEELVVCEFPQ